MFVKKSTSETNYGRDDEVIRVCVTYESPAWVVENDYVVVETMTYNQPEVVPVFIIEGESHWYPNSEEGRDYDEYAYWDASPFFYDTYDEAIAAARKLAANDDFSYSDQAFPEETPEEAIEAMRARR